MTFRWWPRRLGGQLVVLVAGALLLSMALLGAYTIQQQTSRAREGIDNLARSLARTLALACEDALLTDRLDLVENLLLQSSALPEVMELQVLDAQGRGLSHVRRSQGQAADVVFDARGDLQPLPTAASAEARRTAAQDAAQVVAWHPIGDEGRQVGWVRVVYGLQALDAIRVGIWTNTLVAAVLASLLSGAMVAGLMRGPLQALKRAREFASELVEGEGAQLPVPHAPAEVSALTRALNTASGRLHVQRRVIDRTLSQLQEQEARLWDSNEQLHSIFALSPNGLASFDDSGRIRLANDALHRLVGLRLGALEGQPGEALQAQLRAIAQGPELPDLDRLFPPAQAAGASSRHPPVPPRQTLAVHLPGISQIELVGQPMPGASTPWLLHVRDVSHESEIERLKDEFLSTAAHELRTPIVSIYGFVELLLMRDFPPDRRQKMLATVHRQSAILIEIVNDLLDLSRIEAAGTTDRELQDADPLEAVQAVVQGFRPSPVTRPGPEVIVEGPLAPVRLDRGKFAQVMRNLLSNAYKYSPQGGPVRVRIGLGQGEAGEGELRIAVEDQGIGMSPAQLARVFERFYRADASGNIPGTGLGMSIVKDLIELMGGRVEVRSVLGEGSTVTVALPLAAPSQAEDPPPLPAAPAEALSARA